MRSSRSPGSEMCCRELQGIRSTGSRNCFRITGKPSPPPPKPDLRSTYPGSRGESLGGSRDAYLNQLVSETQPAGGAAQTRTHDAAGNLLTLRDFNGRTYAYDERN